MKPAWRNLGEKIRERRRNRFDDYGRRHDRQSSRIHFHRRTDADWELWLVDQLALLRKLAGLRDVRTQKIAPKSDCARLGSLE
jgi:hypothetical protein